MMEKNLSLNDRISGNLAIAHSQIKQWQMISMLPEPFQDIVCEEHSDLKKAIVFGLCIDFMYLYELCARNGLVDTDGIDAGFMQRMEKVRQGFIAVDGHKHLPEGMRLHTPQETLKEMHSYLQSIWRETKENMGTAPTAEDVINKVRKE